MKIYNSTKIPKGLGYDEPDYDAIYQSGYTAGYQAGYDAYECFYVYPTYINEAEGTGGTYTIYVETVGTWTTSWDGMIPGSDWCTFSPTSGEGSGEITLTLQPFENPKGYYELTRMGDLTITNSKGESAVVQVDQRPRQYLKVFFDSKGGEEELTVRLDGDWYISGDTYFGITPMSGTGQQAITVSAGTYSPCACLQDGYHTVLSIVKEGTGVEIPLSLTQNSRDLMLFGANAKLLWVSGGTDSNGTFPIHFPSTGGSYAYEFWYNNKEVATRGDFGLSAPYTNFTIEDKPGERGVWIITAEVSGFSMDEWDGNRPGSRNVEMRINACHDCFTSDLMRLDVRVAIIPLPELHVDTDLPGYAGNPNVPATGGTYTFTVNSNMDWTANTVNRSSAGYNITLSQSSGESGTTVVTATIPENVDLHENSFVIEFGIPNATQHGDIPVYASFYVVQAAGEVPAATAMTFGIYEPCIDDYVENGTIELRETGLPTRVTVSPSGVPVDLVYTSSDPSLITVSSAGVLDCVAQRPWDEVTITVFDNISRLTASASCFVDSIAYWWVIEPNNCPCPDYRYTNDCGCVPASGGTFYQEVVLTKPRWAHSTAINVISTPEWITVSPTSASVGCYGGAIVMNMTVAPCSEVATASGEQRTGTIVLGENGVSGLTASIDVSQYKLEEPPTVEKYVADLVDEGYANFIQSGGTYKGGNYVEILSSCPYDMSEIVDLEDVALNQKQLSGIQNTIVWNQIRPTGWTVEDIAAIYNGQSLNYTPRGGQFWAITSAVSSFTITYTGDTYVTSDYPWGSYSSEGVFAPRWNQNREGEYAANGWLSTPETVTVNFASTFSSVSQVMFTQMKDTRTLTINQLAGTFACHDVTGMFEGDSSLETLNINGAFNFSTWRTQHNVFDSCTELTGIPYSTAWTREHANNEIYPHNDGVRGSANCYHMFRGCRNLEYLGPVFNMGAISLSGCTYDGRSQAALSDTLFNCPALEDVRIKNLNNNDWNFTDTSTYTQIPNMNVASIEYLLNNVEDVTADPHTVTLSTLHQGEISQSAIDNATSKGWTIAYA